LTTKLSEKKLKEVIKGILKEDYKYNSEEKEQNKEKEIMDNITTAYDQLKFSIEELRNYYDDIFNMKMKVETKKILDKLREVSGALIDMDSKR